MDSYQECEVCGAVANGFFCEDHLPVIGVVEEAMALTPVTNRPRWIAVQVVRYLRDIHKPGKHEK